MASFESDVSNRIDNNGIQIEVWEPNFIVLPISDNTERFNTCLQINVAITNNTLTPFPFIYDILTPQLLNQDGQLLHPQKLTNTQITPSQYNGMAISYKQTLSCYLIAKFSWHNNLLKIQVAISYFSSEVSTKLRFLSTFENMQLGMYQLRFLYLNTEREFLFFDRHTVEVKQVKNSAINQLTSSWANLQLIKPIEADKNAVQVDDICFKTVVPEQIWNISYSELSDTSLPVQIGMRITNHSSSVQRFCSFNTLIPALVTTDDFIIGRNLGSGSHGWIAPSESDFHLVLPGENVTFSINAYIEKRKDGLLNMIVNSAGRGYWLLTGLKLGIHKIRLTYRTPTNQFDTKLFEDSWRGMVHTPFLEFCLIKS